MIKFNINNLDWNKNNDGLLPVVIQNFHTREVLMLGYMNQVALQTTITSGKITFFSRSKNRLWTKGESSGHFLYLKDIQTDCDSDAILIQAIPDGPTCHNGTNSCFNDTTGVLQTLIETIQNRRRISDDNKSYTKQLFDGGVKRMAQKVGEEGVETALAALHKFNTNGSSNELINEASDLLFHLLVLLEANDVGFKDILNELENRHNKKTNQNV